MIVKSELNSFPIDEYGVIEGEISSISKDIKVNDENNGSYYIAKITVDTASLYDKNGEEEKLKVGMACEVKIVTEQKRILFYILEKINLLN